MFLGVLFCLQLLRSSLVSCGRIFLGRDFFFFSSTLYFSHIFFLREFVKKQKFPRSFRTRISIEINIPRSIVLYRAMHSLLFSLLPPASAGIVWSCDAVYPLPITSLRGRLQAAVREFLLGHFVLRFSTWPPHFSVCSGLAIRHHHGVVRRANDKSDNSVCSCVCERSADPLARMKSAVKSLYHSTIPQPWLYGESKAVQASVLLPPCRPCYFFFLFLVLYLVKFV